jgi:hypothetical protein
VSCIHDADLLVADLFPLSLGRRQALQAMCRVLTLTLEDAAAHLDDSWLDCERVNTRALP